MNGEIKEVAETLSDYATAEKEKMVREIRNYSIMGAFAIIVYCILKHFELISQNTFYEKIAMLCEIQICISVMITLAHTTGILNRLQKNQKATRFHTKLKNLPQIAQIIVAVMIAFLSATFIKLVLDSVM